MLIRGFLILMHIAHFIFNGLVVVFNGVKILKECSLRFTLHFNFQIVCTCIPKPLLKFAIVTDGWWMDLVRLNFIAATEGCQV